MEADNARLRRLLDREGVPSRLRHQLRNTLAVLRTIVRRSAETPRDLESYVAHLEDRIDAIARAQAAENERGAIGLHSLISDELLRYGASEGRAVNLTGPEVELSLQVGQIFALAIHELAVNALEHGQLGAGGPVDVSWTVSTDAGSRRLNLIWREPANVRDGAGVYEGFGTEILTRELPYELKALTAFENTTAGMQWTISFPLGCGTQHDAP